MKKIFSVKFEKLIFNSQTSYMLFLLIRFGISQKYRTEPNNTEPKLRYSVNSVRFSRTLLVNTFNSIFTCKKIFFDKRKVVFTKNTSSGCDLWIYKHFGRISKRNIHTRTILVVVKKYIKYYRIFYEQVVNSTCGDGAKPKQHTPKQIPTKTNYRNNYIFC